MAKQDSTIGIERDPRAMRVVGKGERKGIRFERTFTTPGIHPYDEIEWDLRDAVLTNWRDGTVSFEQRGVEFPS